MENSKFARLRSRLARSRLRHARQGSRSLKFNSRCVWSQWLTVEASKYPPLQGGMHQGLLSSMGVGVKGGSTNSFGELKLISGQWASRMMHKRWVKLLSYSTVLHLFGGAAGMTMLEGDPIPSTHWVGSRGNLKSNSIQRMLNTRLGSRFDAFSIRAVKFRNMSKISKGYSWRFWA